jgi:UDP-sulfoquinovose synthase
MSVKQIAETIVREYPGECMIEHVDNPRVEAEDHYYNVKSQALEELGLKPTLLSTTLIDQLFDVVERYRDRVDLAAIMPTVRWRETASELRQPASTLAQT